MTTGARREHRHRPLAGAIGVLTAVCVVLVVGPAPPASAHGPTPDATNYRSVVEGVVRPGGAPAAVPGVTWDVLGGDGLLQVRTTRDVEVVISGYDDEPYLRVGPDGVFENRNSPATYLNADRYANTSVPTEIDPAAPPDWRRIDSGAQWRWHDHRIHWMAPTPPPAVRDQPDRRQQILKWTVPFQVDGRRLEAHGELVYIPPPSVWPWLLGAILVLSLPVVGLIAAGADQQRLQGVVVAFTVVVAGGGVAVALGDALATPAGVGANAWAITQTVVPVGIAVALAWTVLRTAEPDDGAHPASTLVVSSVIIAFSIGIARLSQLTASQVTNALPDAVVRGAVAAGLTLVVPAVIVAMGQRVPGHDA